MITCSGSDCLRQAKKRGMCEKHYMRWYVHGDAEFCSVREVSWNRVVGRSFQEIILTKEFKAIVDDEDYERINRVLWIALEGPYQVRAFRSLPGRSFIYMHHEVLGIEIKNLDNLEVDHINRNSLDNRKKNLRLVTHAENMDNTSAKEKRKGYSFNRRSNSFYCYIDLVGGKRKHLGYAKTEELAKITVEKARADLDKH